MTRIVVTVLCTQPKVFTLDLGDNQSRYSLRIVMTVLCTQPKVFTLDLGDNQSRYSLRIVVTAPVSYTHLTLPTNREV